MFENITKYDDSIVTIGNSKYSLSKWYETPYYQFTFKKTKTKHEYNKYVFSTEKQRDDHVMKIIDTLTSLYESNIKPRAERKELQNSMIDKLSIGDIFVNSWGYDQTNIDAYQIIDKKNAKITIKEIKVGRDYSSDMAGQCTPHKDAFINGAVEITKMVWPYWISFTNGDCTLWDGKETFYFSTYA